MGRSDDMIVWVSKGLPFVIVGVYMERDPQAILVHEEGPVRRFADLNGRTSWASPAQTGSSYIKVRYHIDFQPDPLEFRDRAVHGGQGLHPAVLRHERALTTSERTGAIRGRS